MNKIGITTTVPVEVLLAAGYQAVDLNNLFITSDKYDQYIEQAERDGFPKNSCAWIKGIYGACLKHNIKEVISVLEGDCSNTHALAEVLKARGITTYPLAYPYSHKLDDVKEAINHFMDLFGVTRKEVEEVRDKLNNIRSLAKEIDRLTWKDSKATGFENHLYQINCSDFTGDVDSFAEELKAKINEIEKRESIDKKVRLGYIGVPPMMDDLYEFVTKFNAYIVYNEVQREFAFPRAKQADNIYQQYYDYTYPYDLDFRLEKIKEQIEVRNLDGLIHYTQSFCYRELEDVVIKEELEIPILNIRGDKSRQLDSRMKLRLEAFLDMLGDLKEGRNEGFRN
ncbi:2-hydroxyacyl-CoA dehydratase family protein [Acetohalobium arabaticum]|uniref:2-hydroxyglutaryl-CoA dehydratase D-component n=1 Tax=Acetohalobium arabaticum (strain ATCC 49924 / DSM 5501 / Z-7288) TaxID=574087 RepID=D9QQY2_ACEAZ|nr:2-hydroxyacyl-CoA dehydratase [Acetohalobium arabaticum]ADL12923.1 2-hydroxyglutaryl-CoA dehydratase D-component [Acetohalobium arabaticum DSM 5501]